MTPLEAAFADHRRLLWALGFRMLGTPQDADEVVQEAFVRALRSPPDSTRPLRPWLVKVAANVARDRLRRRRRAPYPGPWLPAPLDVDAATDGVCRPAFPPPPAPDEQLERLERLSYGLMVALEQLTPAQRAVWLLREVMGLSTAEAAAALEVQPGSVKVTLHRARRALQPSGESDPGDLAPVAHLAQAVLAGDVAGVVGLLADDVVALSDGGGVFHAAQVPIRGGDPVARLLVGLARKNAGAEYAPAWLGAPAVVVRAPPKVGFAERSVTLFGVRRGRISAVWTVLAPTKLAISTD